MKNKIYNIPASCSFVDVLAEHFIKEYQNRILELVDVIFLLPNKRACSSLREAFVRVSGLEPLMLPKILAMGDICEDELFFSSASVLKEVSPAIDSLERTLIFTKKILEKSSFFGSEKLLVSQACFLAQELSKLIDVVNFEGLSFDNLQNLVPEEYSQHWLSTLSFLEIIISDFPKELSLIGLVNPSEKYNQLLNAQAKIWKENDTKQKIVIAGGIASFPAIRNLVRTVLSLENGELYINGLDRFLDDESLEILDCCHPEFEQKTLLDDLGVDRKDIKNLTNPKNLEREMLISQIMRPAGTTDKWRDILPIHKIAYQEISIVEADDLRQEALAIALMMREALETPEKTTALVTTDRSLARRVSVELERWNIKVDDSAGKPLSLTPVGIFLRLIAKVCESDFEIIDVLSLLKNPFMAMGCQKSEFRKIVRKYEYDYLRLREAKKSVEIDDFVSKFKNKFERLYNLLNQNSFSLKEVIKEHIELAVDLASTDCVDGNNVLWKNDDGNAAASFVAELYEKSDVLEEVSSRQYLDFLESLMINVNVRNSFGTHPRLKILGPIEARLNQFDRVIIGGFNEGIWPKLASSDPFMSRPMKKDFGMSLPEKNIGIMAKDFADLFCNEEVFITRALRSGGTPMIKSRWLMRFETVLQAMNVDLSQVYDSSYAQIASSLDASKTLQKISAPEPRPPVLARPRKLSMSAIESLMKDPYIVFAKYILGLYPLENLQKDPTSADYGNIIHDILDKFNKKYPNKFPQNAFDELMKIGSDLFIENEVLLKTRAFWWPRFEKTAKWIVETETKYRKEIKKVHSEISGEMRFDAPCGEFVVTAKADRIDETIDGKINVIDYKTGLAKKKKEVYSGYAPQLPIEGLIAECGGYKELSAMEVSRLIYWKLANEEVIFDEKVDDLIEMTFNNIAELVSLFDFQTTPYLSKPHYKYETLNKDYEHLARVREWSVGGDVDD